jgi:hypothetical protein
MNPALSSVHQAYAKALGGMDASSTLLHPFNDPARWNARQVIEHLILTYRSTADSLQLRLDRGRPTRALVTTRHKIAQVLVLKLGWYPYLMKAPAPVCPEETCTDPISGEELAQKLGQNLDTMDQLLDQCAVKFGKERVASHFALGALTVDQWRCFHAFHSRHHLKQVARIASAIHLVNEKTASTT